MERTRRGHARNRWNVPLSARGICKTRWAGILPFLFIWQFILSGPLEIASGYIGFAQYVGYFWRSMGRLTQNGLHRGGRAVVALLYRRVTAVGRLALVLWVGMLATVLWIIVSGLANFRPAVAFDFPAGAFTFSRGFAAGLGSAMLIAMYDFMGYYDICYVGEEVRDPVRTFRSRSSIRWWGWRPFMR